MRRVAGQEDPAHLEPLGHLRRRLPRRNADDVDGKVRQTGGSANDLHAALVIEVIGGLASGRVPGGREEPTVGVVHSQEEPDEVPGTNVVENAPTVRYVRPESGL